MHLTSEWSIGKTCAQSSLESKTADWGDVYNGAAGSCGGTGATGKKNPAGLPLISQFVVFAAARWLSSLSSLQTNSSVAMANICRL